MATSVTECPRGHGLLEDLGTPVPWCGECAWTPPETEGIEVPIPADETYEISLPPYNPREEYAHQDHIRLPDQDPEPIRRELQRRPPRWIRVAFHSPKAMPR